MRRSESHLPRLPWHSALSHAERRLLRDLKRDEHGNWLAGTNPDFTCTRCTLTYDSQEYGGCPGCKAYCAARDRERWAAIALTYSAPQGGIH